MKLNGVFTALITPFKNGKIDIDAFCNLIEWQIACGIHGIVVCGTTGEAPTLSYEEHNQLIGLAVNTVKKRIPVIAGATSNNTQYAIALAENAKKADAILIAPPYYNKPTQDGIYQHYKHISDAISHPIIVYNIPGRCLVDINNDTMHKITDLPTAIGIKDATGDLNRVFELQKAGISLLSGDDANALAFNANGGHGCISVTSNIAPQLCAKMQNYCMAGDFMKAQDIQKQLYPLHRDLFHETNPIVVKYALSLIHKNISPELRLPLTQPSVSTQNNIKEILSNII